MEPALSPLFPKATEMLFYTGNTLTLFKLTKKTNASISEEVRDGHRGIDLPWFSRLDSRNDVHDVTSDAKRRK